MQCHDHDTFDLATDIEQPPHNNNANNMYSFIMQSITDICNQYCLPYAPQCQMYFMLGVGELHVLHHDSVIIINFHFIHLPSTSGSL